MPKAATATKTQRWIQDALEDAKTRDIAVLDVRKVCDFTDYMVIATGTSSRHVQSSADKVVDALRKHDVRTVGVEGGKIGDHMKIRVMRPILHQPVPPLTGQLCSEIHAVENLWILTGVSFSVPKTLFKYNLR